MDIQTVLDQFNEQAKGMDPIGGIVKFAIDDKVVLIDGKGSENTLSFEDGEADCTITTSMETLMKMKNGDVNPMMAVMSGKVKISGDMGLAMKLQGMMS
ncbi:MAG: SCP2 sterol-binding domain-containing protein [Saprospiraceae bacterium]